MSCVCWLVAFASLAFKKTRAPIVAVMRVENGSMACLTIWWSEPRDWTTRTVTLAAVVIAM